MKFTLQENTLVINDNNQAVMLFIMACLSFIDIILNIIRDPYKLNGDENDMNWTLHYFWYKSKVKYVNVK